MNKEDLAGFGGSVEAKYPEPQDPDSEEASKHSPAPNTERKSFEVLACGPTLWGDFITMKRIPTQ